MAFQNGSRVVIFDQQPSRILALGLGASELLIELGLNDLVVGRTSEWSAEQSLPKYALALSKIPMIDYSDILKVETQNDGPDFAYGYFDSSTPEPPFVKTYHLLATNKEQFFGEVRDLAKLFRIETRADNFINDLDSRLLALSARLSEADPVKILVVKDLGDGSITTSGLDFTSELLRLAGGQNVLANQYHDDKLNINDAAALNPDYILVVDDGRIPLSEKISDIKDDPVLSNLKAVSDDRLLTLQEAYLQPGPRIADSVELLARKLHPSLVDYPNYPIRGLPPL